MSILIKKFVSSPFCTPKLTYTSGDTDYTADYTEEWGPEFGEAVQAVGELAVELFRISPDHLSSMELGSAEWVTKDGRTKCRLSVDVILKNKSGTTVGPCIMKSQWLNDEDLGGIADDAVRRMEALREVCAEYVLGRQRAQLALFQDEEIAGLFEGRAHDVDDDLNVVDVSSHGMMRQAQREGGESKIDKLNQQYLLDNPDIASRIHSQEGGV